MGGEDEEEKLRRIEGKISRARQRWGLIRLGDQVTKRNSDQESEEGVIIGMGTKGEVW